MITLNQAIRDCVAEVGDPLLRHIRAHCAPLGFSHNDIDNEAAEMVLRNELRMKDDGIDNEWSYRRGKN